MDEHKSLNTTTAKGQKYSYQGWGKISAIHLLCSVAHQSWRSHGDPSARPHLETSTTFSGPMMVKERTVWEKTQHRQGMMQEKRGR